ncbi:MULTISPECIES: gas vesicle protein GvpO [Thermomonospora]|uniref:Gas vesicle synthesis family protein n=1 Tax=Thermomonospora cellulosilytica TaxID=1411118 RepID=A0A7W3MV95_9ACTN|nr:MULTISPECIES: gas vesicle protein [Thermomonospora]MBA9002511.1 hypothetical protein [Thermomonospora cellulosilytica]
MRTEDRARTDGREDYEEEAGNGDLSVVEAARAGARQLADIISRTPEGVVSVEPVEDGWIVEVEVLEARHVPSSSDVLAIYEIELDADGALVAYRRTQRYRRGKGASREEQ